MKKEMEKFEQEYEKEINLLKGLNFTVPETPKFKIPSYTFLYRNALSFAFAVPALAFVFGLFFYTNTVQTPDAKNLNLIEESNARILNQINTLDENTI